MNRISKEDFTVLSMKERVSDEMIEAVYVEGLSAAEGDRLSALSSIAWDNEPLIAAIESVIPGCKDSQVQAVLLAAKAKEPNRFLVEERAGLRIYEGVVYQAKVFDGSRIELSSSASDYAYTPYEGRVKEAIRLLELGASPDEVSDRYRLKRA